MVKVRASTILTAYGKAVPMSSVGASALQVYGAGGMTWSKKTVILRNAPYTIENPHLGQIEARLHFARLASRAKGSKGLDPETGLPQAAAMIHKSMKGYRADHRLPEEAYPSKVRRTYHTAAELEALHAQKLGRAAPTPPVIPPFVLP